MLLFAPLCFAAALPVCAELLPFRARRSDTFASHREASQRGCLAAQGHALAEPFFPSLIPNRAFLCRRSAQPYVAQLLPFRALPHSSMPYLRPALPCGGSHCLRTALLCSASAESNIVLRDWAVSLPGSSRPNNAAALPRRTIPGFAVALERAASPLQNYSLLRRCRAWPSIAFALQGLTWPPPRQGPRREAMISARGCWP